MVSGLDEPCGVNFSTPKREEGTAKINCRCMVRSMSILMCSGANCESTLEEQDKEEKQDRKARVDKTPTSRQTSTNRKPVAKPTTITKQPPNQPTSPTSRQTNTHYQTSRQTQDTSPTRHRTNQHRQPPDKSVTSPAKRQTHQRHQPDNKPTDITDQHQPAAKSTKIARKL